MWRTSVACAGVLACLAGCRAQGGSDVGNGASVTLDVDAYKRPPGAGALTLASGVTVADFWISVGSFRLQGDCGADDDAKQVFGGPIVANLVQPDAAPGKSEAVSVSIGPHCRLRVDLEAVSAAGLPSGAPAELEDAVLYVRGERADGVPFSVRSSKVVDLRLDAPGDGFELEEGLDTPQALVVAFDLEGAVGAMDLDELDDPSIVIDDKTNMSRLAAFENSLRKSASLFEDSNADGVLGDDESSPGDELAGGNP